MMNKTYRFATPTYTLNDVGCYVDSARRSYAVDRIVDFVRQHMLAVLGKHTANLLYDEWHTCTDTVCIGDVEKRIHSKPSKCIRGFEIEDKATDFMNENFPVDGASWGRNENSDWGLWPVDDEE